VTVPVIEVNSVSKDFLLPHLRSTTLKHRVLNSFKGRRGRREMEVQHALREIDFHVDQGAFFGVIGRNGSGKSTLLKILAGIYHATSGSVVTTGRLVPFIELGVGFNPELTGRENVYLNGALLGFSPSEVEAMYDDIVAFAELEGFMDQKLKNYSSGMQVRIAFSVATRARADILLIDEVLAVGDVAFQRKCFDHFRALKRAKTTIVFVTHDMRLVREFCDRVILIEGGRVLIETDAGHAADEYGRLFASGVTGTAFPGAEGPAERWGEGDVRFSRVVAPETVGDTGPVVLEMDATVQRPVDDATFSVQITSASGTPILGTSPGQKQRINGGLTPGERIHLEWQVPNVFSKGLHSVDVTVTDRHELVVYDFWKDAARFSVEKEDSSIYPITPETTLSVERVPPP
jgi:ABC-2 type transport system ATP-binding protein